MQGADSVLNNKLVQHPDWIYDANGKITGYKTPGGADTVFPFSREAKLTIAEELLDADNKYGLSNKKSVDIPGTILAVFPDPEAGSRSIYFSNSNRIVRSIGNAVYWDGVQYIGNVHSASSCSAVIASSRKRVELRNLFSVSGVAAVVVYEPD